MIKAIKAYLERFRYSLKQNTCPVLLSRERHAERLRYELEQLYYIDTAHHDQ